MDNFVTQVATNNAATKDSTMPAQAENQGAVLPAFIHRKIAHHQADRIFKDTQGKPLIIGLAPTADSLVLQSNDYLNISNHPRIVSKQIDLLAQHKRDLLMSSALLQDNSLIRCFERRMAAYVGYQQAMLFTSGWSANIGLMEAIADEHTNVYIDFFAHMSLWEGIKSCGATPLAFRHNSSGHLEKLIKQNGPGIIVVDSVYSTLGTLCPLLEIANIAEEYGCALVVDESHSLGLYGPHGAGLVAELDLTNRVHFITASLAKAFAGRAGIVLSATAVIDCMPYVCRPAIFSSTLLNHEIAALSATLDFIVESDGKRQQLQTKAAYLREHFVALGYAVYSGSHIVSIEVGSNRDLEIFRDALEDRDIFGAVFCAPATPKNRGLIRFSIHSDVTYAELNYVIDVCAQIKDSVGVNRWKPTIRFARTRAEVWQSKSSAICCYGGP